MNELPRSAGIGNSARTGDRIDAHVDIDKPCAGLHFSICRLMLGSRCQLKADAAFAVIAPR